MGADVLSNLTKQTSTSHDDLGSLVHQLADAATPLQDRFNGEGKAAFNSFKLHTDEIATELNAALASVLEGIQGQDVAFRQGDAQMAEQTRALQSGAGFEAARFSGR